MSSTELENLPFYRRILNAEKQNESYNPRDVFTYSQESIASTVREDMEIHMFALDKGSVVGCYDKFGRSIMGGFHSETPDRAKNAVLKFTKPAGMVVINTKKFPSVFPSFIVNRYKLYESNIFSEKSLIHNQRVKYFYCTKKLKFVVKLPDHFFDEIHPSIVVPPLPNYRLGMFFYQTEQELMDQYPKDIDAFSQAYVQVFDSHRAGTPVIMVYSSREISRDTYFDTSCINSNNQFSDTTSTYGSVMQVARGVLYGNLFYQIDNDGKIASKSVHQIVEENRKHLLSKAQNIMYCIPDEEGQWEKLMAVFEAFKRAQAAFDAILEEGRNLDSVIGKTLQMPSLEDTVKSQFLLTQD